MQIQNEDLNLAHGLALLMMQGRCYQYKNIDDCTEHTNPWEIHPFGLDIPDKKTGPSINIDFVGAHGTLTSVEVFLAHIRFWAGYVDGRRLTKLRVINMQYPKLKPGNDYVFFEVQNRSRVIISGETTNFSGGGNTARRELENVFAILAQVYELEIERVRAERLIPIQELYDERAF